MNLKTWGEAKTAMEDLAAADAALRRITAKRDEALANVHGKYSAELTEHTQAYEQLQAELKKFAQANKSEFKPSPDGDGRTYTHASVDVGFRRTPPFVNIRVRKPEDVEELLQWLEKNFPQFVRVHKEPNREALLETLKDSDPALSGTKERLAARGITIDQKDKFFLEVRNSEG